MHYSFDTNQVDDFLKNINKQKDKIKGKHKKMTNEEVKGKKYCE